MGVSFQIEWHYLQSTIPGVGTLVGPIEEVLRETFFPVLFRGGGEIDPEFRTIVGHNVNNGGLGITDPGHK